MSRKTSPDIEAQVVILREAGHTAPAIAAQLDLSLSTAKRICRGLEFSSGECVPADGKCDLAEKLGGDFWGRCALRAISILPAWAETFTAMTLL